MIVVEWRFPDGCARAARIRVMGVGEAAHHERAHCGRVQAPVGPGERRMKLQRAGADTVDIVPPESA